MYQYFSFRHQSDISPQMIYTFINYFAVCRVRKAASSDYSKKRSVTVVSPPAVECELQSPNYLNQKQ